jgi:hypothetical protein
MMIACGATSFGMPAWALASITDKSRQLTATASWQHTIAYIIGIETVRTAMRAAHSPG